MFVRSIAFGLLAICVFSSSCEAVKGRSRGSLSTINMLQESIQIVGAYNNDLESGGTTRVKRRCGERLRKRLAKEFLDRRLTDREKRLLKGVLVILCAGSCW